ncbi:poly [ADP-ribose] polymerase 1-like [Panonychus citri]|uniref:poly [ADP-ribose] polymerase 1-like n=1 Tax=Panonychus citri TaxID=50023 RepID=UPI002307C733|nr:poly [ADP-ribose] polymerase 1-like [Panonychus citri]
MGDEPNASLRIDQPYRSIGNASGATACLSDFGVEYSKSGKETCVLCESKISLNEVRISKTDEESDAAVRLGRALPRFFHVDCFVSARQELGFFDSADKLPNFDGLEASDRQILKKKLPKLSGTKRKVAAETNGTKGQSEPKKSKVDKADKELEKSLQEQSNLLYKYIDQLKTLKANELDVLLLHNNYDPPKDRGRKAEVVADAMAFGALSKCPECKTGQLYFRIAGYICSGMVSDCVKCVYETVKPARKPFKVPTEYKEIYEFLAKYKYKPRVRVMGKVQGPVDAVDIAKVASSSNGNDNESEHKIDPSKPLKDHKIVIFGKLGKPLKDYKKAITDLGGSVVTNFDRTVLFGITNDKEIDKGSDKVEQSEQNNVILVNEKVIEEMKKANIEDIPSVIVKHGLSEWGAQDVAKRFVNLVNKSKVKSFKSARILDENQMPINLNKDLFIFYKVSESLHQKHQLLVTCLERVFTLPIWPLKVPTIVIHEVTTTLVYLPYVKWHLVKCWNLLKLISSLIFQKENTVLRVSVKRLQTQRSLKLSMKVLSFLVDLENQPALKTLLYFTMNSLSMM